METYFEVTDSETAGDSASSGGGLCGVDGHPWWVNPQLYPQLKPEISYSSNHWKTVE
jgi:hypothetical protein